MNTHRGHYILIAMACAGRAIAGLMMGEHWLMTVAELAVTAAYLHMGLGQNEPKGKGL
jgi:hypothetical protein